MSLTIYYTLSPFAAVLGTNGEQQLLSAPSTPHCSHIPGIQERGYEEVEGTQDKFWRASFQKVSEELLATAWLYFWAWMLHSVYCMFLFLDWVLHFLCTQYRRDLVNISKHCTLTHEEAFLIAGIDLCQSSLQLYCSLSLRRKHRWERQHLRLGMMFLWYHSESECAHSCCLLASLCHWIFKLYLMKKCQCSEWSWYYFSV